MSNIKGIDVSHWQGNIDWSQVANDGVVWAIAKATEGSHFIDDYFDNNYKGMIDNGIVPGAYHMFRENVSGVTQADYFLNKLLDVANNYQMLLAVDVERNDNVWQETARDRLRDCLYRIFEKTGRIPFIYTSDSKWRELIEYYYQEPAWTTHVPLWVAHYGTDRPTIPDGWLIWYIWQYSSTGSVNGVNGNVDLDWFRGSMTDLQKFSGIIPDTGDLEETVNQLQLQVASLTNQITELQTYKNETEQLKIDIKNLL